MAAVTPMPGDVQVTEVHVERAFRRLQKRHWPQTLAKALQHPLYGRCIRGMARALAHVEHRATADVQTHAPQQQPAARRTVPPKPPTAPAGLDRKRRAAGEHDDDIFSFEP